MWHCRSRPLWLDQFKDFVQACNSEVGMGFRLDIIRHSDWYTGSFPRKALVEAPWDDNPLVPTNFDPLWRGSYKPEEFWELLSLVAENYMLSWLFQG